MPSEKHFLYHLIISQLYHDGYGSYACLLEEEALHTNQSVTPSDRLKQMLSACAHTVREVDNYLQVATVDTEQTKVVLPGSELADSKFIRSPSFHNLARRKLSAAKRHSVLAYNRSKFNKMNHLENEGAFNPVSNVVDVTSDNMNSLQNLLTKSNLLESNLFNHGVEQEKSVDTVSLLQNFFQNRHILPTTSLQSEVSLNQNITNLITASQAETPPHIVQTTAENSSVAMSPMESHESSVAAIRPDGSPDMDATGTVSPDTDAHMQEELRQSPLKVSSVISLNRQETNEESETKKDSPSEEGISEKGKNIEVKEEPHDTGEDSSSKGSPTQYSPSSQDIINQLSSLSAPGMKNIQSLATSITNSFTDSGLPDSSLANLSSLSLKIPDSLTSSISMPISTGFSDKPITSITASEQSSFTPLPNSKMELLTRLDGSEKPSMLSMVNNSMRSSGLVNNTSAPTQESMMTIVSRDCDNAKQFMCSVCGRLFTRKYSLKVHFRIHSGERPYLCRSCGRRYSDSSNYRKHIQTCMMKSERRSFTGGGSGGGDENNNTANIIKTITDVIETVIYNNKNSSNINDNNNNSKDDDNSRNNETAHD